MPTTHGQKVDLGNNAPTTQESTGPVTTDSLAAQSTAFKSANPSSSSDLSSHPHHPSSTTPYSHPDTGAAAHRANAGAEAAPSYVNARDVLEDTRGGPKGEGLMEEEEKMTGRPVGAAVAGTSGDPGRRAEEGFEFGRKGGVGDGGEEEGEGRGKKRAEGAGEQPFGVLDRETSA